MMEIIKSTAPSSWASALINGDYSEFAYSNDGTNESADRIQAELAALVSWLMWINCGPPVSCEDAGFIWIHDASRWFPFGSDCQEYVFLRREA